MSDEAFATTEEFAWEFRWKGTGDPDSAFGPWRAIQEGRLEIWSPSSSHFEFRRVSAQFANRQDADRWIKAPVGAVEAEQCGKYSKPHRIGGVLGPCVKPPHGNEWHVDASGAAWDPSSDQVAL